MMAAKYKMLKPTINCSICNQWWGLDFRGGVWVCIWFTYQFWCLQNHHKRVV